jgi:hypothetical protein
MEFVVKLFQSRCVLGSCIFPGIKLQYLHFLSGFHVLGSILYTEYIIVVTVLHVLQFAMVDIDFVGERSPTLNIEACSVL